MEKLDTFEKNTLSVIVEWVDEENKAKKPQWCNCRGLC